MALHYWGMDKFRVCYTDEWDGSTSTGRILNPSNSMGLSIGLSLMDSELFGYRPSERLTGLNCVIVNDLCRGDDKCENIRKNSAMDTSSKSVLRKTPPVVMDFSVRTVRFPGDEDGVR